MVATQNWAWRDDHFPWVQQFLTAKLQDPTFVAQQAQFKPLRPGAWQAILQHQNPDMTRVLAFFNAQITAYELGKAPATAGHRRAVRL